MATQAHCIFCFESLVSSFEQRDKPSLSHIEQLWGDYTSSTKRPRSDEATPTAAKSLKTHASGSPASASSASTPSKDSGSSSAAASSATSLDSAPAAHLPPSPLFVTWNKLSRSSGEKNLRGCIGTFEALEIEQGLHTYALTSAFDDTRFSPIAPAELPRLSAEVTLLTDFEPAADAFDWSIGTHGLRISFSQSGRRMNATYLPSVAPEQGWDQTETLVSLMRKAGWQGRRDEWRDVRDLKVIRYQGKKVSVGHAEWAAFRAWMEEKSEV